MARIYPNSRPSSRGGHWPKRKPIDILYGMLCKACEEAGLPEPEVEYTFHPERKWRFDFAWPAAELSLQNGFRTGYSSPLAIEVQGGTYKVGKHSRGAGQKNDMEKNNEAVALGWRVLYADSSMIGSQPKRRKFVSFVLSVLKL